MIVFSNQGNLVTGICNWLNRRDSETQARAVEWIGLAEAKMKRLLRPDVERAALTIDDAVVSLPSDVAEPRTIALNSGTASEDARLQPKTPDEIYELRQRYTSPGKPIFYAVVGGELMFAPTPDTDYAAEIIYTKMFVSISDDTALLQKYPDLYLFGSLSEAAPYLEHDERLAMWNDKFESAIAQINAQREMREAELQVQAVRLPRVF